MASIWKIFDRRKVTWPAIIVLILILVQLIQGAIKGGRDYWLFLGVGFGLTFLMIWLIPKLPKPREPKETTGSQVNKTVMNNAPAQPGADKGAVGGEVVEEKK